MLKLILDPNPDSDQHRNLTTSRGSPLAHAYHVWSTSVNAFVNYPAHKQNKRITDRMTEQRSHNSATLGGVIKPCGFIERISSTSTHDIYIYRHNVYAQTLPDN